MVDYLMTFSKFSFDLLSSSKSITSFRVFHNLQNELTSFIGKQDTNSIVVMGAYWKIR
jgi:hypothetical protein